MAKEKVYKLAQEFKVSSEALVQMLRGMGITVKSHMSTVDESLRNDIKKKFELERAEIKKEYDRKKQILTKAREDLIGESAEVAPPPAPPAVAGHEQRPPEQTPALNLVRENQPKVPRRILVHLQHLLRNLWCIPIYPKRNVVSNFSDMDSFSRDRDNNPSRDKDNVPLNDHLIEISVRLVVVVLVISVHSLEISRVLQEKVLIHLQLHLLQNF